MVIRSVAVLGSAMLVATAPTWLEVFASWGAMPSGPSQSLPFSPYWIAVPAALTLGASWVYELRITQSSGLPWLFAPNGLDVRTSARPGKASREGWQAVVGVTSQSDSEASVWKRLESDFKNLRKLSADLDVSWRRSSAFSGGREDWEFDRSTTDNRTAEYQFDEIAETAGRMLVQGYGYKPPLSDATAQQPSNRDRWLCTLRDREIKTEATTASGAAARHFNGGVIREVMDASIELCVQLMLEESLDDRFHVVESPPPTVAARSQKAT